MTEIENLYYKAGEYAGKAAVYRILRGQFPVLSPEWIKHDEDADNNQKKATKVFKRAVKLSYSAEHVNNIDQLKGGEE